MHVRNADPLKWGGDRFTVELWVVSRVGNRSDVENPFDAMRGEKFNELFDRAVRVADGVDGHRPDQREGVSSPVRD